MQIDTEQLARHLSRQLAPLYAVHGDEPLLAIEAADRIRAAAVSKGYGEREILLAESGFEWRRLWATGASLSLFSTQRLVELRIPTGSPGSEGGEALVQYCASLPPDTVTLVTLPALDRRARETKWFQALDRAGVAVQAQKVSPAQLPAWLAQRLQAQNQSAGDDVLEWLSARVEGNLLAAHQEVRKLALLFPEGPLDLAGVQATVMDVARFEAFSLGPAVLAGDPVHLVRMLEGLRGEGAGLALVLWAFAEEIRSLLRVQAAVRDGAAVAQAMRDARVWGERQKALPGALRRLTRDQLVAALAHAARIDRMIKGVAGGEPWDELRVLALRLTAPGKCGHLAETG